MNKPKVVLLCGGKGTRLEEIGETTPKPLVLIGGMPIVWHIMKNYAQHGFTDFILCTGYQREKFINWWESYLSSGSHIHYGTNTAKRILREEKKPDWNVTFADTGQDSLTGERILRVKEHLKDSPYFLCTYGDGVSDVNILDIIEYHQKHNPVVTLMGTFPPSRFGELETTADGLVVGYHQKPKLKTPINAGFMVMSREFLEYLKPNSMIEDPFPVLAKEGKLRTFEYNGFWQYMDTPQELTLLRKLWDSGNAKWKNWND